MSFDADDRSMPDVENQLLARFLQELEAAPDRLEVVAVYSAKYPTLAGELATLEEMNRLIARASQDEIGDQPRQLGEFRIVRRIAQGGMGDIYEAVQDRLNRRVAVKTIRRGRISPQARGRFFREQRVLARLHQTNILPIHAAGEDGELLYFAMPFVDGAALNLVVRAAASGTHGPSSKTPSLTGLAQRVRQQPATETRESPPTSPQTLSPSYFRSAAQVIADVADAIEHAHRNNVLHRDIKPSNILIDGEGQCWIIDFGLAGYLGKAPSRPEGEASSEEGDALTTERIIGTPQYMAPEQWRGEPASVGTDVWGLGVTLYELLTLRRAFDGGTDVEVQNRVLESEPVPAHSAIRNVPPDLEAICRKAMQKDANARYHSARSLADDLRRWLRHEPVTARSAGPIRRVSLWARRNPGWASTTLCVALAVIAGTIGMVELSRRQAVAARREARMLALQRVQSDMRVMGWRESALSVAREVNALLPGEDVRDQVGDLLAGLDATKVLQIEGGASAAQFSADGRHMLLGGRNDATGRPISGARLVHVADGSVIAHARCPGTGPVTFASNGQALQLVPRDRWTIALEDVAEQKVIHQWRIQPDAAPEAVRQETYPVLALMADFAAAAITMPDGSGVTVVWDTHDGKEIRHLQRYSTSLALSPDGAWLAAGDSTGAVTLYSLKDEAAPFEMRSGRVAIQVLTFGRDPWRQDELNSASWILAAGGQGTRITLWDLRTRQPRSHCDGSPFDVNTLALSPDGMTLASGGRYWATIWDVASGQQLLQVRGGDRIAGLTFDSTGSRLVVAGAPPPDGDDIVRVWELQNGNGFATLRGLIGPVESPAFSPDGRLLAALSHQWQIGVWDVAANRLLHILEGPRGEFADNAGMAFNQDSTWFACSAGTEARLWDVKSGLLVRRWTLPPGLQDTLHFSADGQHLWLARVETKDGVRPYSHHPSKDHPRIIPFRDLLRDNPLESLATITDADCGPHKLLFADNGRMLALHGCHMSRSGRQCVVGVYELPSAKKLWLAQAHDSYYSLAFDRDSRRLGWQPAASDVAVASDAATGTVLESLAPKLFRGIRDESWIQDHALYRADGRIIVRLPKDPWRGASHYEPLRKRLATTEFGGRVFVLDPAVIWQILREFDPGR